MSEQQVSGRTGALRVVDLFCGAGGLSAGFTAAGFEPVFALDKDEDSAATYRANHPDVPVHIGSIADLSPGEIAESTDHRVDVIVGGPSCQGFSTANRSSSKADDERNELWTHMMDVVRVLKPRAFLLENVAGMVQFRRGGLGAEIVAAFEDLGYQVQHRILMAADYGVPQRRRRLFIVGVEQGATFEFPSPTHHGSFRRDHRLLAEARRVEQGLLPHLSCWEAIADLPACGPGAKKYRRLEPSPYAQLLRRDDSRVQDHDAPALPENHARLIERVPQGGTWRDIPAYMLPERFLNMRRTDSTNLFGRLDPSLPSYTITTQFTNVTAGCNTHPFEDRSLSIREGARLQSFPDDYRFVGSTGSRARQIGNAVPPLLAHALAWQIAVALQGKRAADHHRPQPVVAPAARAVPVAEVEGAVIAAPVPSAGDNGALSLLLHELGRRDVPEFTAPMVKVGDPRRAADLVFQGQRLAVFVNECFLNGCDRHNSRTRSATFWWARQIKSARSSWLSASEQLRSTGWQVVTVWEHDEPGRAADRVMAALQSTVPVAPDNGDRHLSAVGG